MRSTAAHAIILVMLTLGLVACDDSTGPRGPLAPTPPPPVVQPAPQSNVVSLRGAVIDSAYRPVGGARVEVLDGPDAGRTATTDATGQFFLNGNFDSTTRFAASVDGYVGATRTWTQCATCPVPYLSFMLALSTPPIAVAGEYTVTFVTDSACAGVPSELHTRTYSATMAPNAPVPNIPDNTSFSLVLKDGTFLREYDRIWVGVAGNFVSMSFGGHGPYLIEEIAANTYLAFDGTVQAVASDPLGAIAGSFAGWVHYCALPGPMGAYYDCPAGRAVASSVCESQNHRMILTRR